MNKTTAVITGDIVASGKISPHIKAALYTGFKKFMTSLRKEDLVSAFELYRGDSMQCMMQDPASSLRVALLIRSWFKSYHKTTIKKRSAQNTTPVKGYYPGKYDIRVSIGIGAIDLFNKTSLGQSDGEVFLLSGRGLDGLKHSPGKMIIQSADINFTEAIAPSMLLLDAVVEKWTSNQAEIVYYKLKNFKEEQIAAKIGISQSAVNQRTKNSRWYAIEKLLSWFEKTVKQQAS